MFITIPERFKYAVLNIKHLAKELNINAYIVGGFIRDCIMEREPKDLDIMVDAPNGGIMFAEALCREFGYPDPVVFPRFGTAQVQMLGELVEFVMPRAELYYEGSRKPDTEFSNIKADALRRDFSMNALFFRISDGEILDLTGHGLRDIKNRVICVTDLGNENIIFTQDPLRQLRAIRFSCKLGFTISDDTYNSIVRNASKILDISYERIQDEISKILTSDEPAKGINLLRETGLSNFILPEINALDMEQPEEFHHKNVYEHTLLVLQNVKNTLELRLTALLHDIGKPVKRTITESGIHFYEHEKASADIAKEFLIKLKYPNEIINTVTFLIYNHMRPHSFENQWTDSAVRRFIRDMGSYLEDIFEIVRADVTSSKPAKIQMHIDMLNKFRERITAVESVAKSTEIKPILNGNELMKLFNKDSGRWIREVQGMLMSRQLENPLMTKEDAIMLLTNTMENGIM